MLDGNLEDRAMLEIAGKKMHSDGLREPNMDDWYYVKLFKEKFCFIIENLWDHARYGCAVNDSIQFP